LCYVYGMRTTKFSIFCIIILQSVIINSWGQPKSRIDTLYNELITPQNELTDDTNNVRKFYEYAILCSENEGAWDVAKEPAICYDGFYMSVRLGYEKGINDFIGVLQKCFKQREGMPRIIVHTYPDAVSRDTLRLLHQARKQLHGGTVDWYRGAFDKYKELRMHREAGIVRFWNALAYYDSESFREAMRLFEQAGIYFTIAQDHTYLLKLSLYKACTYYYQKNYQAALKEFDRAKNECLRVNDSSSLALTLYNRGEIYTAMQNHQSALEDFSEAFRLEQLHEDTSRNISGRIKIARAYYALNKFADCVRELKTALSETAKKS